MYERIPAVGASRLHHETLDAAAARHASAEEPSRNDTGVVDDNQVGGIEGVDERRKMTIGGEPGGAIEHQQPRVVALGEWDLRDQIAG